MHDVGLGSVFRARTICYVEREAFSAAQLVALMDAQCLDAAPVWSDLATFDARPWRGCVDGLVAGLPCQPYSVAGKREGNADRRAIGADGDGPIVHFLRIVAECGPAVVWLENVPAWVTGGWFRPVGEQLCRLGYELEAPLFLAADDVGASHQRERVWLLAYQPGRGQRVLRESWRGGGLAERGGGEVGTPLAREHGGGRRERRRDGAAFPSGALAYAHGQLGSADSRRSHAGADRRNDAPRCGAPVGEPARIDGGQWQRHGLGVAPKHGIRGQAAAWPTPDASVSAGFNQSPSLGAAVRPHLASLVESWPTPNAADAKTSPDYPHKGGNPTLVMASATWATPTSRMEKGGGNATTRADGKSRMDMLDWQAEAYSRPVLSAIDGRALSPTRRTLRPRLNPAFAAWLMGLPWWWTNPAVTNSVRSAMAAYRSALRSHGARLLGESWPAEVENDDAA
jgi:hypothetical protein